MGGVNATVKQNNTTKTKTSERTKNENQRLAGLERETCDSVSDLTDLVQFNIKRGSLSHGALEASRLGCVVVPLALAKGGYMYAMRLRFKQLHV